MTLELPQLQSLRLPDSPAIPATSVVIPAFNEREAIGPLVWAIRQRVGAATEVLVVDDGSTDGTAGFAEAAGAKVVRIPRNSGNGSAVKAGIRAATGELVAIMDGDGQHDPNDLLRLVDRSMDGFQMVVGERDRATHANRRRRMANALYNRLASYVTDRRVGDLTSGFRVIRADVAREFLPLLPNGFSSPTTLTLACMRAGYQVDYVPIKARKRSGRSKIRYVRDGASFLMIIFKIATLFSPMKAFLPLAVLGGSGTLLTLCAAAAGAAGMWLAGTILGATTLGLVGLGLVSEQICAMRYEQISRGSP